MPAISDLAQPLADVQVAATQPEFVIAVRELCEFAAKSGDLDLRFTPSPTAQEGIAGHKKVAARRGDGHRTEVWLTGRHDNLLVRGRADGFNDAEGLLEEVKTFRGDLSRQPANQRAMHWAQARTYGWLLCQQLGLATLRIRLVYFDIGTEAETVFEEVVSVDALRHAFEGLCARFAGWARQELGHRSRRNAGLDALSFLHPEFRTGQRALAEHTFMAIRHGRCLMAQAGTGIGKTVATLFPALKAMPTQLDKIFFLTAKASGQLAPMAAIEQLAGTMSTPLRTLQLVARDTACERPGRACHGESCDLARGFYDRLPAARQEAVDANRFAIDDLRAVARAHAVCPYYLAQELARWADVVVADVNYYFDGSALLHALTAENAWRVAVLVDEAHNLVERGRAMYTTALNRHALRATAAVAPPALGRPLRRLGRAWGQITKAQREPYAAFDALPSTLTTAVREVGAAIGEALAEAQAQGPDSLAGPVLDLYFETMQFARLAESFGGHSVFDVSVSSEAAGARRGAPNSSRDSSLCIRNVVPAPFLATRLASARATVLFSATLSPHRFYADTLGLPSDHAWLETDAPFSAAQLDVRVVADISTRYLHRPRSLEPIARLIAAQLERQPGNYIAFFSSHDYLEQVADALTRLCPHVDTWRQARRMSDAEKVCFLERFAPGACGVGFAVLGGSFAEGVDLPGERLIGAFVATLGLPQFNPVNEQMRKTLQATFGAGYDYAYLFPGIRKVVQAAGRVVRTTTDRGTVHLIDDRFARPEVRRLLPAWWALPAAAHS